MDKFEVSNDFSNFEALNAGALDSVRQEEHRSRGIPLPIGFTGRAMVVGAEAKTSPVKVNADKTTSGGNPMVTMNFAVVFPESAKALKFSSFYVFNQTANMSAAQRYQMWLDACQDMGLPPELRKNGRTADILNWFAQNPNNVFDFEIVASNYGMDGKEFRPIPKGAGGIPTATATAAASMPSASGMDRFSAQVGTVPPVPPAPQVPVAPPMQPVVPTAPVAPVAPVAPATMPVAPVVGQAPLVPPAAPAPVAAPTAPAAAPAATSYQGRTGKFLDRPCRVTADYGNKVDIMLADGTPLANMDKSNITLD